MSKTKHTPGPWQVKPWKATSYITLHIQACNERAELVARVECWVARVECREEQDANARLIAAAPDLLEALKSIVEYCEARGRSYPASARAAIAKAEGKE